MRVYGLDHGPNFTFSVKNRKNKKCLLTLADAIVSDRQRGCPPPAGALLEPTYVPVAATVAPANRPPARSTVGSYRLVAVLPALGRADALGHALPNHARLLHATLHVPTRI